MASIKIVEYYCPHCGEKLSSFPSGKNVCMGLKRGYYGQSIVNCKKCKRPYRQIGVHEAALFLTEEERVPLLASSPRWLIALMILVGIPISFAILTAIYEEDIGMVFLLIIVGILSVLLFMVVVGFFTRPFRQNKKNTILNQSRKRLLNDDAYMYMMIKDVGSQEVASDVVMDICSKRIYLSQCFDADILP